MDIYWIENGKRKGPVTVPDIISLVQMGELTPDTKGWHAGCQQWMPLRELPALADFLGNLENRSKANQQEEATPSEERADAKETPTSGLPPVPPTPFPRHTGTQAAPQIVEVFPATASSRLTARLVDSALYAALALGIAYMLGVEYNSYYTPSSPAFWLPMVVLEAFCLSRFGTTPGKLLMRIRLASLIGMPRISFGRALLRSALVFFLGMGLMMFPVGLVMMLFSYWNLRSRGICLWDARATTIPVQPAKSGAGRFVGAIITIYLALTAAGLFMQPWLPTMLDEIEQQSPDAARQLRDLMQYHLPAAEQNDAATIPQPKE